eukprot:scaffold41331_cov17-Tisochrysis_lutea.AAC.1
MDGLDILILLSHQASNGRNLNERVMEKSPAQRACPMLVQQRPYWHGQKRCCLQLKDLPPECPL